MPRDKRILSTFDTYIQPITIVSTKTREQNLFANINFMQTRENKGKKISILTNDHSKG